MKVDLPGIPAIEEKHGPSLVIRLATPPATHECSSGTLKAGYRKLPLIRSETLERGVIVARNAAGLPQTDDYALTGPKKLGTDDLNLTRERWLRHPKLLAESSEDRAEVIERVLDSWLDAFSYIEEDTTKSTPGLRIPQLGALHAVRAHWTVSSETATVVMPTGTGKTDTMLSILVTARCEKILVVVPTDALRSQLAGKFLTLGVLKQVRPLLAPSALSPVVCILKHRPKDPSEARKIFDSAQVIVATSAVVGGCDASTQQAIADRCSHLFIDEAHHAEAPTWRRFREKFRGKPTLQFTATPFRDDKNPLDGKLIYTYPLSLAQKHGYFRPIRFQRVVEFNPNRADAAIADAAIKQLKADYDKGHILMARVADVRRAQDVFKLYAPHIEFHPVQLHTGIKAKPKRDKAKQQVIDGTSRIVVCVDMLGEGFDLPELKIAAFHDVRKSLPVTLQLAGRFTRSKPGLGEAVFIANTADIQVQEELQSLYSQDPDWNQLLPDISDKIVKEQLELQEFLADFDDFCPEVPLRMVEPATSCVAYRTDCDNWNPENFRDGIPGINSSEQVYHSISQANKTLVIATVTRTRLKWTDAKGLFDMAWELYVLFWDKDQNLLFINCSNNDGAYRRLAQAVCGESATLIRGQDVFRTFSGVNRLTYRNVGLTENFGRNVRYTGRMGSDVETGLGEQQKQRATKSVLSGAGFSGGARVTVGASKEGRIWSQRRCRIDQWVGWCRRIGNKLLDTTIDPDDVLSGTLRTTVVLQSPSGMPIAVEWPEVVYRDFEEQWRITTPKTELSVGEVDIRLHEPSCDGRLTIAVSTDADDHFLIDLELLGNTQEDADFRFVARPGQQLKIRRGTRRDPEDLADFFTKTAPTIWFADGSSLEGNQFVEPRVAIAAWEQEAITALDWTGVDITKESQGPTRKADTVQARLICHLKSNPPDVLFDDDGSGEAADVVAASLVTDADGTKHINVEFYHCKYSGAKKPGARVGDLYEVCGQAQRSVHWLSSQTKGTDLFSHLLRREAKRQAAGKATRFEIGDQDALLELREASKLCPMHLRIFVVQPGLSKKTASTEQLNLLGVTKCYLFETYQAELGVLASA